MYKNISFGGLKQELGLLYGWVGPVEERESSSEPNKEGFFAGHILVLGG